MPKAVVFASGHGSNAEVIFKTCQTECPEIEIMALVTDKPQARVVSVAKQFGLPIENYSVDNLDHLIANLKQQKVEWIFLAGFMRILPAQFVAEFRSHIVNIHPSLLPNYPGLNAYERIFFDSLDCSGITIHFVDEGLDSGPIILQESFAILPGESLEQIKAKGQSIEHQLYKQILKKIARGDMI